MKSEEQIERRECDYRAFKSCDPDSVKEHYLVSILSTAGYLKHFKASVDGKRDYIDMAIEIEKIVQNDELQDALKRIYTALNQIKIEISKNKIFPTL